MSEASKPDNVVVKTPPAAEPPAAPVTPPTTEAAPERPQWLPEKFKSPEDLAKSYSELEKKLSGKSKEAPAATPEATKGDSAKAVDPAPTDKAEAAAQEAVADAGLDWSSLRKAVDETGTLAEDHYKALESKGIPKDMVDDFIAGQKARGELIQTKMANEVGGVEQLESMKQWMAENMSEAEILDYNAKVTGRDQALALAAVKSAHARYQVETGITPKLVRGGGSAATADVFHSIHEYAQITTTDKYRNDPGYRKMIDAKLERSNF